MFQFPIPELSWIFLGIEAVAILVALLWLLRPLRRCKRLPEAEPVQGAVPAQDDNIDATEADGAEQEALAADAKLPPMPSVSVIVYAGTDEEAIGHCLEQIYAQEYPDFEVIVVCDGTAAEAEYIDEKFKGLYPRFYATFIPPGSHNLSRRKLALTLGMKAAKGDVVVTTVVNIEIPSTLWLATLCSPFTDPGIAISLGYSHMDRNELRGPGKWYRGFVSLLTSAQWIGYALGGHPYRGDGYNLAFRRREFFAHKGYSQTIYLQAGDDDIFVNEIVAPGNFALAIDSHAILTTRWDVSANRVWTMRKEQYDFTSRWLPRAPFVAAGAASAMQWLVAAAYAASLAIALPNIVPAIAGGVALLLFWLAEIYLYRTAASRLGETRLWFAVPIFWLAKPLCNYWFRLSHRGSRIKNFTWQRRRPARFRRNKR